MFRAHCDCHVNLYVVFVRAAQAAHAAEFLMIVLIVISQAAQLFLQYAVLSLFAENILVSCRASRSFLRAVLSSPCSSLSLLLTLTFLLPAFCFSSSVFGLEHASALISISLINFYSLSCGLVCAVLHRIQNFRVERLKTSC